MIALDFLYHNIYASPLDSITYDPGYTLKIPKIWKNEFFEPPFFYERKIMQGHMMMILISLDKLYVHICMVPILDWPKCLFGTKKKKKHDFWPHKGSTFFRAMWGDFDIFWHLSSRSTRIIPYVLWYLIYPKCGTPVNHTGPAEGRIKKLMSDS